MDLVRLETILVAYLRPTFLAIYPPNEQGDIQIIISCIKFNFLTVQERILEIYNLIQSKYCDILQNHLLIITALNSGEMEETIGEIFK